MKAITEQQKAIAVECAKELDFKWWFDRVKVAQARQELSRKTGFAISAGAFRDIRKSCEWFRTRPRPKPSSSTELTAKQWARLESAVKSLSHELHGRSLKEAVAIVSTVFRCNTSALNGLTKDCKVWGKQTANA